MCLTKIILRSILPADFFVKVNNVNGGKDVELQAVIKQARCMHWMSPGTCTYCNPVSQGPVVVKPGPKGQNSRRTKNQITPTREVRERYYVLVHSKLGREDPSFGDIQKQTEIVHVTRALYLWVVKKILQLGPKVRTIECTPKALLGNSDTIRKLCRGHGVEIVGGFNRADLSLGE